MAKGIKESVDIETSITDKLQSVVGDKFNVDQLLEQVALGAKSEDKAISEIAKVYGFKKSRQKKVEAPVEPVIQPGAVAEEIKENVAEIPAKAEVTFISFFKFFIYYEIHTSFSSFSFSFKLFIKFN